jgi:hypothetical protein
MTMTRFHSHPRKGLLEAGMKSSEKLYGVPVGGDKPFGCTILKWSLIDELRCEVFSNV